jgi:sugar lactone lactonase YvrE
MDSFVQVQAVSARRIFMNSKNTRIIIILFFLVVLDLPVLSSDSRFFAAESTPYTLVRKWQTDGFLVPESILFDGTDNILYVSNINGKPTEKDQNGFISKVTLDGKIDVLKWATGLNAPKGSAISGDFLYVSDIDHLVQIHLKTGKIENRFPAQGAKFLNDVVADRKGNVYVSDMSAENSVIYQLSQGRMQIWLTGPEIKNPNGLHMESDRLIIGNSGDGLIKAVNLLNKKITALATVGTGIDGLRPDGNGNFFVSDWQGKTSLVMASGQIHTLLDTTASKVNSADLEYIISRKLLLIPTFFDNRVVAYEVK